MPLVLFEHHGVRNLQAGQLLPHPQLNLIVGANASGKTSLLEAIHILGTGKSFRTNRLERVLQHNIDRLTVFGRHQSDGVERTMGYQRHGTEREIHINGEREIQLAALAQTLPLQVISPDTHFSFLKHAKYRRAGIDWGLFHVEPDFYELWSRHQRLLKQRNAALKQGDARLEIWDQPLASCGEEIHSRRQRYLQRLQAHIERQRVVLLPSEEISLQLRSGWRQGQSLAEVLAEDRGRDREHGYTRSGAHRADLEWQLSGQDARQEASQGQWKLLTLVLRLAQMEDFVDLTHRECILLLDDLPAELDAERRESVMSLLASLPLQIFATATEREHLVTDSWKDHVTFHVELGNITQK
ncbi:MAG: DNA replication/repair protein RecF [Acidiferrobacterales bacterium]